MAAPRAKAERPDGEEIVIRQFRGAMALDGERELGRAHPAAVIGDGDEGEPALAQRHLDAARAGIDGVLDELLDDGRRPLDDLAGGDAVDPSGRPLADGHGGGVAAPGLLSRPPAPRTPPWWRPL